MASYSLTTHLISLENLAGEIPMLYNNFCDLVYTVVLNDTIINLVNTFGYKYEYFALSLCHAHKTFFRSMAPLYPPGLDDNGAVVKLYPASWICSKNMAPPGTIGVTTWYNFFHDTLMPGKKFSLTVTVFNKNY